MNKIVKLPKPNSNQWRLWTQATMMFCLISMIAGALSWGVWTHFAYDGSPITTNDLWVMMPVGVVYLSIGFVLLITVTFLPTPMPSAGNLFLEISRRVIKIMIGLYLIYTFIIVMMILTHLDYTSIMMILGGCFFGTAVMLITVIAHIKT